MAPPGICGVCHAPAGHPMVSCPLCGALFAHVFGVNRHLIYHHPALSPSRRLRALILDIPRAQARGWPLEGPRAAAESAGIQLGVG